MNAVTQIVILSIFISLVCSRPSSERSSDNELRRSKKAESEKLQHRKKSVYSYLESKLVKLSPAEQERLARKLISRLHRHFTSRRRHHRSSRGPWVDNGEVFARMLK